MGKGWSTKADVLCGIPQGSVLWPILFTFFLLTTYRYVFKAVAKSLLMILNYSTRLVTVVRYRNTSTDYKNGMACGIYTLMLQSVKFRHIGRKNEETGYKMKFNEDENKRIA